MRSLARSGLGIVVAGAALFATGAASFSAQEATPAAECAVTTKEENIALVSRWYDEVWNERDMDVIGEILADDYIRYRAGIPFENEHGLADDVEWVETIRAAFPDLTFTIEDVFADGDKVAVRTAASGTHMDAMTDMGNAPATERTMTRENIAIWRVACGRLAEQWIVQDNLGMLRQLGVISDDEMADTDEPTVATPVP